MLEAMLKHFRSYGMRDLQFIAVNSKLSHSQEKFEELAMRVSFEVYQETEDEEVWSIMDGGKDDMFIYDRCGRLTYFVPFPLSILNESPIVSNAILSTYFRNPCGEGCGKQNSTLHDNLVNSTTIRTEVVGIDNETPHRNETIEDPVPNDLLSVLASGNHSDDLIDSELDSLNMTANITETEYLSPKENDEHNNNETNSTTVRKATEYFNNLFKIFFIRGNDKSSSVNSTSNGTSTTAETPVLLENNFNVSRATFYRPKNQSYYGKIKKNKSDRCAEADISVCKNWSKKRLLHAQRCCRNGEDGQRPCNHYGKRRCKKIQLILKCCIQTLYIDETPIVEDNNKNNGSVECCKNKSERKYCRFVESGICEDDEEKNMKSPDCTNLP